jgi:hypothetical protein
MGAAGRGVHRTCPHGSPRPCSTSQGGKRAKRGAHPNSPLASPAGRRPKGYGQPQAMNVQQAHQPLVAQQ